MVGSNQPSKTTIQLLRAAFRWYVSSAAGKGHLEVERKFPLAPEEASRLRNDLPAFGFSPAGIVEMTDSFLPGLIEGEMLRVRHEQIDAQSAHAVLTFKQWVETSHGRERQETERTVRPSVGYAWMLVGRLITGAPLMTFGKRRYLYEGDLDGFNCVISIDNVSGLGSFSGWYLEVELLVPIGENTDPYVECILTLAARLLGESRSFERRSYRDMLILSRQTAGSSQ